MLECFTYAGTCVGLNPEAVWALTLQSRGFLYCVILCLLCFVLPTIPSSPCLSVLSIFLINPRVCCVGGKKKDYPAFPLGSVEQAFIPTGCRSLTEHPIFSQKHLFWIHSVHVCRVCVDTLAVQAVVGKVFRYLSSKTETKHFFLRAKDLQLK